MTLSDTQLVLLSAAAQRDDGRLTPPERLKGYPRQALTAKLLKLGLVETIRAGRDSPAWGDGEDGPYGLRITPAGLRELGLEPTDAGAPASQEGSPRRPRATSKIAQVLCLLEGRDGASLVEIEAATGWLPHTVRAALTGLRKQGYRVERLSRPRGQRVYGLSDRSNLAVPSSASPAADEVR
jgi:hypothetical protein